MIYICLLSAIPWLCGGPVGSPPSIIGNFLGGPFDVLHCYSTWVQQIYGNITFDLLVPYI